jgi:hypothetical protein
MRRIALIIFFLLMAAVCCPLAPAQDMPDPPYHSVLNGPYAPAPNPLPTLGLCDQLLVYQSPVDTMYFRTEAVAFQRDWQASQPMATLGNPTNVVLSTHDLQFTMQPGLSVLLGRRLNNVFALEGGFIGLLSWNESRTVQNSTINSQGTAGNLFSPFTHFGNPAQVGLDYNTFSSIRTATDFNTAELNIRQRFFTPPSILQASGVYGFRYINIHDRFEYRTRSLSPSPAGSDNAVDVVANNGLFGVQAGGTLEFQIEPRGWINFEAKGIMCRNGAREEMQYTVGPIAGPGTTVNTDQTKGRMALGADVQGSVVWKFTPAIVGRAGYQCIFIDGLVLGSDNFGHNAPLITTGHTDVVSTGNLAFHGPFAGLTVTW